MTLSLLKFRAYDKVELLENDPWTVCKVIKLLIKEESCYQLFQGVLMSEIPFIPNLSHQLPLTVNNLISKHWLNRAIIYGKEKFEPINILKMIILAQLLAGCNRRVSIESVYQVALESNMSREARTEKFFNVEGVADKS